jgi:hypothetical protein
MTVYRLYSGRELQFDINLLTSAFPVALADALDRVLTPDLEMLPTPRQPSELIVVQAS